MPERRKGDPLAGNGEIILGETTHEMEKSLITAVNPVVKPPRQYSVPPSVASGVTEVSEVNRTLLDNDSVFGKLLYFLPTTFFRYCNTNYIK